MNDAQTTGGMNPLFPDQRHEVLDALRGMTLLGVLLVNLLVGFRVSLLEHILTFHTHPGWANHAVDILVTWFFEFKAFTLFSFLFGIGVGVQADRAGSHNLNPRRFFLRRFTALLAIGLCHMLMIWNGDILVLYAVCGFLLILLVAMSSKCLTALGVAIVVLSTHLALVGTAFPPEEVMRSHAAVATQVYATGSFGEITKLRLIETVRFVLPLLINSMPRTFGLMLIGIAAWRSTILLRPAENRRLLNSMLVVGGSLGGLLTTLQVWLKERGQAAPELVAEFFPYSSVLLAFAYGAAALLWLPTLDRNAFGHGGLCLRVLASAGRMALSNYLTQSIVFGLVFYGYGLGLFGRLGSAAAALLGLMVFAVQLIVSDWWLQRFYFGPAEWLWRSLTYGQRQPLRRKTLSIGTVIPTSRA